MYLRKIGIKNIGPIDQIAIDLPFNSDGIPKPIVFVGENGSGKTILLFNIVDSFIHAPETFRIRIQGTNL